MHSDAENEVRGVIDFVEDILFAAEHSMHFEKLSGHILHCYATSKTFFPYYNETERLSFFKKYPNFFLIDNGGIVSSIKTEIIHTFNRLIEVSGEVHFLKLVKTVEKSSSYFHGWTESEQFNFFRNHSHLFNIRGNGYISVKPTQSVKSVFGNNDEKVKSFFKNCLEILGPMYFTWLYEHLKESSLVPGNFHKGMRYDQLWNFFKVQDSVFVISKNGFVTLASCQSCSSKFISKPDNDLVIGFFITKLITYGSVLYTLLLKFLQESTLEVEGFFAGYSLSDILDYFIQHSDVFVLNNNYVSLKNNGPDTGPFFSLGNYQLFYEEKQQAVYFFLNCLKTTKRIHFTNLSMAYETSDIDTNFKFAFAQCSFSEKFWFFKNAEIFFAVENDGYVSMAIKYEDNHMTKHIAGYFVDQLKKFHSISFWTLVNSVNSSSPALREYFHDFPLFFKYYFFKNYSEIFSINTDGMVSLTENLGDNDQCKHIRGLRLQVTVEISVIKILINRLKTCANIHFLELCNYDNLGNDKVKKFFQQYSDVQKRNFFLQWQYYFHIDKDYVSISSRNEIFCNSISVPKSKSINMKNDNNSICCSSTVNNVAVSEDVKGLVPQNSNSAVFSYKSKTQKVAEIIEILINQLSVSGPIHFEKLTSKFNENMAVLEFFQTYSVSEKRFFFMDHCKYFQVNAGYVYLKNKAENKNHMSTINQSPTPMIELNKKRTKKQFLDEATSKKPCHTDKVVQNEALKHYIIKMFRDQLSNTEEHLHFLKLCKVIEDQNEVVKRFFSSMSISEKYKFFKTHSDAFLIGNNGYVRMKTQGVVTKRGKAGISESPCVNDCGQADKNAVSSKNIGTRKVMSNVTSVKLDPVLETKKNCEANKFIFNDTHEQEVFKVFEDLLKTSVCLHFLKLFNAAEYQSEVKNFFSTLSVSEKYQFLKSRSNLYHIDNDGYVRLHDTVKHREGRTTTQTVKSAVNSEISKLQNGVDNVITSEFRTHSEMKKVCQVKKYVSIEGQEREVIRVLTDKLQTVIYLHFSKLCNSAASQNKTAKKFFSSMSPLDKYEFIKNHSNCFHVDKDGFVRRCYIFKCQEDNIFLINGQKISTSEVEKSFRDDESICVIEQKVIKILINVLRYLDRLHFVKFCNLAESQSEVVKNFFSTFSISSKHKFFKSHSSFFLFGNDGYLRFNDSIKHHEVEKFVTTEQSLNVSKLDCSNTSTQLDRSTVSSGTIEVVSGVSNVTVSEFQTPSEAKKPVEVSKSVPTNYQKGEVIKVCVDLLKTSGSLPFLKLCNSAECQSKVVKDFFSVFSDCDKHYFFKNHPKLFHIDKGNFVYLSDVVEHSKSDFPLVSDKNVTLNCSPVSNNEKLDEDYVSISVISETKESKCNNPEPCCDNICDIFTPFCNSESFISNQEKGVTDSLIDVMKYNTDHCNNVSEEILIDFFQDVLHSADTLHYEELIQELENYDVAEQLLVFEKLGKVKFFENHPDIFAIDSDGFISLKCPVTHPTNSLRQELSCNDFNKVQNIEKISTRLILENPLKLSELHVSVVRYFAKTLSLKRSVHYKLLVKDACLELVAVKSFFMLFTTSADIRDFIQLHDVYFTIDSEEMVSLKQSDINCDQVLASDDDIANVIQAIITRAVKFYRNVLHSEHDLSLNVLKDELSSAPGYIISFFNVNYPNNDLLYFFRSHHNCFHVSEDDRISLITNKVITEGNMHEDKEQRTADVCIHNNNNEVTPSPLSNLTTNEIVANGNKYFELQKINDITSCKPPCCTSSSSSKHTGDFTCSTAKNVNESKTSSVSQTNDDLVFVGEKFDDTILSCKAVDEKDGFRSSDNIKSELETITVESSEKNDEKLSECDVRKAVFNENLTNKPLLMKFSSSDEKVKNEFQSETEEDYYKSSTHCTSNVDIGECVDSQLSNFQHVEITPESEHILHDYDDDMNPETYINVITNDTLSPLTNRTQISSCSSVSPNTEYFSTGSIISTPVSPVKHGIISASRGGIVNVSSAKHQYLSAYSSPVQALEAASSDDNAHLQSNSLDSLLTRLRFVYTEGKAANHSLSNFTGIIGEQQTKSHLSYTEMLPEYSLKKQQTQLIQRELQVIANFYDPELEELCVQFFKTVLLKNAHKVINVKFLQLCTSHSEQKIKTYLSNYIKQEFSLFFYLHLDHFTIDSDGYVRLRSQLEKKSNVDLECKAVNFFAALLYGRFKEGTSCSVLQNCLYLAAEEVRNYMRYKYPESLQMFFRIHSRDFLVHDTGNVSLK